MSIYVDIEKDLGSFKKDHRFFQIRDDTNPHCQNPEETTQQTSVKIK